MAHDNELLPDENINYRPWDVKNVEAGMGMAGNRAVSNVKGLVAVSYTHLTTSYYMRGLRAIYNRAVEKELTVQRSPFRHVYTCLLYTSHQDSNQQDYHKHSLSRQR